MANTLESAAESSSTGLSNPPALSFAGSFAEVLTELGQDDDDDVQTWSRFPAPEIRRTKPSLTFQKIDIREGYHNGCSEIHLFGLTKTGNSILVRVQKFGHYFYYPSPPRLSEEDLDPLRNQLNACFPYQLCVSSIELEDHATIPGRQSIRFLKINLADHRKCRALQDMFTRGQCDYRNVFSSPELSYEGDVPYFLRYMVDNEILALSWLKIPARKYDVVASGHRISCCQLEVSVDEADLLICDVRGNCDKFSPLRILSFDIECNISENEGQFSDAKLDSVIQIGAMVSNYGRSVPFIRTLFTLGDCAPIPGTKVQSFEDEKDMLMAWHKFFMEVDPDIVTGYNIAQFDIHYLLERASVLKVVQFPYFGRIKFFPQRYDFSKGRPHFSSCPGYEGRLLLDVYHHLREYHQGLPGEGAYKLNNVSQRFLDEKKEDMDYREIPKLQNDGAESRKSIGIYCLKDVWLALRLFEKLKCFEKQVREAQEAHVPFNTLRVWKGLAVTARSCVDAIERHYVVADRLS